MNIEYPTAAHVELRDELVRLVTCRLLDPLEILVQSGTLMGPLHERVRQDAEMWAAQLLGADAGLAGRVAVRLVAALYPADEPFDPPESWWRTPLGRITARRVGHPAGDRVSFSVAGAMLGITRQGVHDLVSRKKLRRHPDGGVTTASVRARLDQRVQGTESPAGGTNANVTEGNAGRLGSRGHRGP